jgi:cytochrome c553
MKRIFLLIVPSAIIFAASAQNIVSNICAECHGKNMAESCMGVSKSPNSLTKVEILAALNGYKEGKRSEYSMGSTMTEKLSNLSTNDIEELSEYIPTLK